MKIKKNDNVIVISGASKGKTGKVLATMKNRDLIVVEGVNLKKKAQKATKAGQKGQIIEKLMPINVSNVMLVENNKPVRTGYKILKDKKVRVSKKTGKEI